MVGDHQISERVYTSLKCDILDSRRTVDRLNINALADKYDASATPVREALLRLVGEGLVEMPETGGFALPVIDSDMARNCYEFSLDLALLTCRHVADLHVPDLAPSRLRYPIDALLFALARCSKNDVMICAVSNLSDRMHPIRLMEERRLTSLENEIAAILEAFQAQDTSSLCRMLRRYHLRRLKSVKKIIGDEP